MAVRIAITSARLKHCFSSLLGGSTAGPNNEVRVVPRGKKIFLALDKDAVIRFSKLYPAFWANGSTIAQGV